jgi:hypothetical protein
VEAFKTLTKNAEYQPVEESNWQGVLPTMMFAIAGIMLLLFLSYRPVVDMKGVGMVFPFSMSEEEILNRVGAAGGRVLRFGGFGHMAVVIKDDGSQPEADDFGALFTLSPLIASACFEAGETNNAF